MIYTLITIYITSLIWGIVSILLYGSNPTRSIGWLFIVICVPFLGIILYIIFGINRKKINFFKLSFTAKRRLYDIDKKHTVNEHFHKTFNDQDYTHLDNLLRKSSGFYATGGNKVEILNSGEKTFNAIFKSIENAQKFIHLQYYIFEEGELLDKLIKILQEKTKEGIEIRLLYDGLGSYSLKNSKIKILKKIGVKVYPILPLKINTILTTLNFRNHRKIIVIDGKLGFTGGVNITDKYIKNISPLGIWDDLHLKIEGPAVDHLHRIFIKDYYFASNEELLANKNYLPEPKKVGNVALQIVSGGPDHKHYSIMHQYIALINISKNNITIENPYFIPNRALLEALKMAKLRGVEIDIMIPKNNDSKLAKHSMYSNFGELLEIGVKIHLLKDRFSHSKLIIIDRKIASIGSGNFDYRSFEYNYETNALIYDKKIAEELQHDFESNLTNCTTLSYEHYQNRSMSQKLLEGFANIFSPLL